MQGCAATDIRVPGGDTLAAQPPPSDEALLARIAEGDRVAFGLLVERHTRRFYALAYRCIFRQAEAEDIVQDAFLKLWHDPRLWRTGRGAKFTTWFYRLVINLCHDHNKRKRPGALPEAWDTEDTLPGAEETLIGRRRKEAVDRALQRLPQRQRLALNLCFYEELSNKEAAEILGIRLKALESLLMRAKAQLRDELKEFY